ncbi:polysaccharide deacetylase family protein [Yoonia sp. F2084L]|uniref:polysaccharide deacetylase family protein n=1 Tax=Yoonia sp. F2084L TaxID=2926419 RepID=UPI001FF4B8A3|nr:polysaccharide deacetylase family protein [Yoonia sp. F2084L]MCK0096801.1 polysaccharide deacetylase family protein [Yoonia sp. F2084L]
MQPHDSKMKDAANHSVIILHGIGAPQRALEAGEDAFWLSKDLFRRTLDQIALMGDDAPMITFDDGNASDISIAMPELAARSLTATFFVLTQRLDTPGSLTSEDVGTLAKAGHAIGLHGHAHVDWRELDEAGRHREFVAARARLAELAGYPIQTAAAPFGLYNRQTIQDLRGLKFDALYTSDRGLADAGRFVRPRNCLEGAMDQTSLQNALRGRVPPLRAVRRCLGVARKRLLPVRLRA